MTRTINTISWTGLWIYCCNRFWSYWIWTCYQEAQSHWLSWHNLIFSSSALLPNSIECNFKNWFNKHETYSTLSKGSQKLFGVLTHQLYNSEWNTKKSNAHSRYSDYKENNVDEDSWFLILEKISFDYGASQNKLLLEAVPFLFYNLRFFAPVLLNILMQLFGFVSGYTRFLLSLILTDVYPTWTKGTGLKSRICLTTLGSTKDNLAEKSLSAVSLKT